MLQEHNQLFCIAHQSVINMKNSLFTKIPAPYQKLLEPVIKVNKLSATNLEALVNFQMHALQSYVDMAMARVQAMAEITDPEGLQNFLINQVELVSSLNQKFLDDSKALGDLIERFQSEFNRLLDENQRVGNR